MFFLKNLEMFENTSTKGTGNKLTVENSLLYDQQKSNLDFTLYHFKADI